MKRKNHSKSGLFLIELMISILFFSITAAVFMQVFVKANNIRKQSRALFEAQTQMSSLAEIIRQDRDFVPEIKECYPQCKVEKESLLLFYDKQWEHCDKEKAAFLIQLTWEEDEIYGNYHLQCLDSQNEEIYGIHLKKWLGE